MRSGGCGLRRQESASTRMLLVGGCCCLNLHGREFRHNLFHGRSALRMSLPALDQQVPEGLRHARGELRPLSTSSHTLNQFGLRDVAATEGELACDYLVEDAAVTNNRHAKQQQKRRHQRRRSAEQQHPAHDLRNARGEVCCVAYEYTSACSS